MLGCWETGRQRCAGELTKLHEETIRTTPVRRCGAVPGEGATGGTCWWWREPRQGPGPDAGGGAWQRSAEPAAAGPADEGRRPPGGGGHRSLPQRAVSGGTAGGVRQGLSADAGGAYDRLYHRLYKGARIFRRPPEAAVAGQEMRLLYCLKIFRPQGDQQLDRGRGRYGDLPVLRHRFRHRGSIAVSHHQRISGADAPILVLRDRNTNIWKNFLWGHPVLKSCPWESAIFQGGGFRAAFGCSKWQRRGKSLFSSSLFLIYSHQFMESAVSWNSSRTRSSRGRCSGRENPRPGTAVLWRQTGPPPAAAYRRPDPQFSG